MSSRTEFSKSSQNSGTDVFTDNHWIGSVQIHHVEKTIKKLQVQKAGQATAGCSECQISTLNSGEEIQVAS